MGLVGGSRRALKNRTGFSRPLISIITVVYNGGPDFEKTLQSICDLLQEDSEYVVIDGGSSDGTLELLRRFDDKIDLWKSEPDLGIYDAMNKAFSQSTGEFILTLNVGDTLISMPIAEIMKAKAQNANVVLFDVELSDHRIFKSVIDFRTRFSSTVHHQGVFYNRDINIHYNTDYKVYADFDLNQRLYRQHQSLCKFDKVISLHTLDGISNNTAYRREYYHVIRNNFGMAFMIIGYVYFHAMQLKIKLFKMFK